MGAVRSGWDDRTPRGKQREQPRRPNLARMGNCDRRLVARPRPLSFLAGASAYRTQALARRNAPIYASWYGAIPVPSWRAHINFYALCTANTMTAIDLRVDLPKWIRDGPKRGA